MFPYTDSHEKADTQLIQEKIRLVNLLPLINNMEKFRETS